MMALLWRHLAELLGELAELLGGLLGARALERLATGEPLEVARQLLDRRAPGVRVRIDALLELCLGRREVGQRLLAAARVLAQLALQLGKLLIQRGADVGSTHPLSGFLLHFHTR